MKTKTMDDVLAVKDKNLSYIENTKTKTVTSDRRKQVRPKNTSSDGLRPGDKRHAIIMKEKNVQDALAYGEQNGIKIRFIFDQAIEQYLKGKKFKRNA